MRTPRSVFALALLVLNLGSSDSSAICRVEYDQFVYGFEETFYLYLRQRLWEIRSTSDELLENARRIREIEHRPSTSKEVMEILMRSENLRDHLEELTRGLIGSAKLYLKKHDFPEHFERYLEHSRKSVEMEYSESAGLEKDNANTVRSDALNELLHWIEELQGMAGAKREGTLWPEE